MQESQAPGIPVAPEPEIEIAINNVVCSFSVRCHLNLRKVATEGMNVIYKRENGVRAWSYEAIVAAIYLLIDTYNTYKKYKNLCVCVNVFKIGVICILEIENRLINAMPTTNVNDMNNQ